MNRGSRGVRDIVRETRNINKNPHGTAPQQGTSTVAEVLSAPRSLLFVQCHSAVQSAVEIDSSEQCARDGDIRGRRGGSAWLLHGCSHSSCRVVCPCSLLPARDYCPSLSVGCFELTVTSLAR